MAQKEVSLVVSGEGSSKKEATDNALRSAIEQAFGSFVSSNTMIINDELANDNIATFSKGTVKEFQEINSIEANGTHYVTLNATVSTEKLVSYVQAKGGTCELAGATFMANLRMLEFHRESTKKTIANLIVQLAALAPHVYDISIEPHPQSSGEVKLDVKFNPNQNMVEYEKLILTTLEALSISSAEKKSLEDMGEGEKIGKCKIWCYDRNFVEKYSKMPGLYSFFKSNGNGTVWVEGILTFYCPINGLDDNDILTTIVKQCLIKDNLGNVFPLETYLSNDDKENLSRHKNGHFYYYCKSCEPRYSIPSVSYGYKSLDEILFNRSLSLVIPNTHSITIPYTKDQLAKLTNLEVVPVQNISSDVLYEIGLNYLQKKYGEDNKIIGEILLETAAARGNIEAMKILGIGSIIEGFDFHTGTELFKKVANTGDVDAQIILNTLFGIGDIERKATISCPGKKNEDIYESLMYLEKILNLKFEGSPVLLLAKIEPSIETCSDALIRVIVKINDDFFEYMIQDIVSYHGYSSVDSHSCHDEFNKQVELLENFLKIICFIPPQYMDIFYK